MADDAVLDVPALTALLDGRYAEVRDLVRDNLAEHASILDDAEEMSRTTSVSGCSRWSG